MNSAALALSQTHSCVPLSKSEEGKTGQLNLVCVHCGTSQCSALAPGPPAEVTGHTPSLDHFLLSQPGAQPMAATRSPCSMKFQMERAEERRPGQVESARRGLGSLDSSLTLGSECQRCSAVGSGNTKEQRTERVYASPCPVWLIQSLSFPISCCG